MDILELVRALTPLGTASIYLAGVIYLFRLYRATVEADRRDLLALLERYHVQVADQEKAFNDLADKIGK